MNTTNAIRVIAGLVWACAMMPGLSQTNGQPPAAPLAAASNSPSQAAPAATVGARDSKQPAAQAVYECRKTDERITVDGKLEEDVWRRAPAMSFVGLADGSKPPFLSEAKMLWDDKYLYVGYTFDEPDIRAYWAMEEADCPGTFVSGVTASKPCVDRRGVWDYTECAVMYVDRFAKLTLDPDGDGISYLEFQCNPLNNYFDAWYKQGLINDKWDSRERYPSVEWKCPGLLSATHIDGTVNAPHDVDRGWALEMAIPWTALAPFTRGACPPAPDDVWGGMLARVYRDGVGGSHEYWGWPLLGQTHFTDRHGKLIFKDETRHFERFFAWGTPTGAECQIQRMMKMGVTDLCVTDRSPLLPETVARYAAVGINVYPPPVTLSIAPKDWDKRHPGVPPPFQKMTDAEVAVKELLNGTKSAHRSSIGKPGEPDEPPDWNVTAKQKKAIAAMSRINYRVQSKYQWGGEIEEKHFTRDPNIEVLIYDILCFNTPEVKAIIKDRIKEALAIPGVKGVAFDGVGYQNYYACFCPVCEKLFKEFCDKEKKDPKQDKTRNEFSLKCLVDFNNEMVDYVHALKAGAVTLNHIWPVFMPEPLYGNRLKMDFCGQTAAWYQYWDPWRIEKYARVISGEQEKYWKGVKGVAFIGYYDNPEFPVKTPAKVESELRAILRGSSTLMMCGLDDLLKNEDVCAVFERYCHAKTGQRKP